MRAQTPIAQLAIIATIVGASAPWAQARRQSTPAVTSPKVSQSSAPPSANVEIGRQVYTKKGCYACHGREGQGSPTTGPRLGPNPMPLPAFTRYIRAPRGQMPPYTEKVLPDAELADIYAFLQARPRPAPIDLLQPK